MIRNSKNVTNNSWAEEGWVPDPKVIVEDYRVSPVLDQNGNNFLIERKTKLGFDLTKKDSK